MILPLAGYIAVYVPWAVPWQQETPASGSLPILMCWNTDPATGACTNAWPVGHTGQTLMQLTEQMYAYHNDLRATHAASSPWWAWPLDLKPVWFESVSYGPDLGSWIHDGGNPVLWWLAIPGMAFVCWQAFKRRSLGLALIAIAFFWQWLSWARIDRAAFQYHFYTALPFFLLGLAYFLAELWHGPSRRTWLLARVAAVAAAMVPAALWVAKYPLCSLARVDASNYFGNTACGSVTGTLTVEARILLIALVLVGALAVLALTLIRLERRPPEEGEDDRSWIFQLILPVAVAGALILWLGANGPREVIFRAALPPDLLALIMAVLGVCLGILAITARDSRRLMFGICIFAIVTFAALYPDLSALPDAEPVAQRLRRHPADLVLRLPVRGQHATVAERGFHQQRLGPGFAGGAGRRTDGGLRGLGAARGQRVPPPPVADRRSGRGGCRRGRFRRRAGGRSGRPERTSRQTDLRAERQTGLRVERQTGLRVEPRAPRLATGRLRLRGVLRAAEVGSRPRNRVAAGPGRRGGE